ncbi:hypothetical protein ACFT7S_34380 [Streptomyces sp. NPDC057136]|uniref:hypothetical protein n=1 Tax=Streptomyces sp. NPDC057136 TaxID=3346029 RepID=UPI003624FC39
MTKSDKEIMEILEAYDLTGTVWSAATLARHDPKTVKRYVEARASGRNPYEREPRPKMIDTFLEKVEEWVEQSKATIRADVVHEKLVPQPATFALVRRARGFSQFGPGHGWRRTGSRRRESANERSSPGVRITGSDASLIIRNLITDHGTKFVKISTTTKAVLLAASAMAVLAPSQAVAAEVPACTTENVAYLDAQDKQEDADPKIRAAEVALDEAKADRATLDEAQKRGEAEHGFFHNMTRGKYPDVLLPELKNLKDAVERHDATGTADAAVAMADALDKASDTAKADGAASSGVVELMKEGVTDLRTVAEKARKATKAGDVEARKGDVDTAIADKAEADKSVRPARDAYRDCLAKANG